VTVTDEGGGTQGADKLFDRSPRLEDSRGAAGPERSPLNGKIAVHCVTDERSATTPVASPPADGGSSPLTKSTRSTTGGSSPLSKSTRSTTDKLFLYLFPPIFVFLWATGFLVARYAAPWTPAEKFLCLRFGLATLCFALWCLLSKAKWPEDSSTCFHLCVVGILTYGASFSCVWVAIRLGIGAGTSSLIGSLQPVLTTLFLAARGQKILSRQWFGMAIAVGGLILVLWQKLQMGAANASNITISLVGLFCITSGGLYQKAFLTQPVDVRTAQFFQQLAACMFCIPFAVAEVGEMQWTYPDTGGPNWALIGPMLWSVLALSLATSCLFFMMIARGAVNIVTSQLFLVPPTTAILAWLIFSEPVPMLSIIGICVTVVGVAFVVKPPLPSCLERQIDRCFAGAEAPSPAAGAPAALPSEVATAKLSVASQAWRAGNVNDEDEEEVANPTAVDRTPVVETLK
jgi:drug/metabolite transporter (DMT)-like permease